MPTLTDPQNNVIRLARATNIRLDQGVLDLMWLDRVSGFRQNVPLPQPYVGRGWGIHCGIEEGSICVVGLQQNKPFILASIPHSSFYRTDILEQPQTALGESRYFIVRMGEIALQSKYNSVVHLDRFGSIEASTPQGNTIRIDNETNTIGQVSAQRVAQCENGITVAGQVLRDIRSPEERINDILFSGFEDLQTGGIFDRIVGVDPQEDVILGEQDPPRGLFDPREGSIGTYNNPSSLKNPALTEWNTRVVEFSDGNIGLDEIILSEEQRRQGFLPQNDLARITIGTVVNDIGKQLRFDYGFGDGGHGHGKIFANYQFFDNSIGYSTDLKFNGFNTISVSQNQPEQFEWTIARLEEANFATALRFLLHTKGANFTGRKENTATRGSYWSVQVDKEGFTKVNIPAATDGDIVDEELDSPVENFRRGRSLLLNLDGSATVAIGKENTTTLQTDDNGLSIDDGLSGITATPLVNRRNSREDRSLTLDLLGNIEALIGGDAKSNQSVLLEADGSISLLVGKEFKDPEDGFAVLTEAYNDQEQGREDRSLTAEFLGNIELLVGRDEIAYQSIMLQTVGGNHFVFGKDTDDYSVFAILEGAMEMSIGKNETHEQSITIETLGGNDFNFGKNINGNSIQLYTQGGIRIQVAGANEQEYALELDATGKLKLVVSEELEIEAKEAHLITEKFAITGDLEVEGDIKLGSPSATQDAIKGASLSQYLMTHTHGNGNFGADTTPPLQAPSAILSNKVKLV